MGDSVVQFGYDGGFIVYRYKGSVRQFLFLKKEPRGRLDLPKGHIEKGENAEQAAIRETKEEAGIDVKPDRFFRFTVAFWFMAEGEKIRNSVRYFLAQASPDAQVKISKEHTGFAWLTYEEAMKQWKFKKDLIIESNSYIDRLEAMEKLNAEYAKLPEKGKERGHWDLSANFVPGEGPLNAKVMVVGQAPGAEEDMQGRPFVGRSGVLLSHLLKLAGLRRDGVYITSVVQFFPPKNRMPDPREVALCKPFLEKQIEMINPKLIVTLGALSSKELVGAENIMQTHGQFIEKSYRYFVTIHPAAAVRLKKNVPLIEHDFMKLKRVLGRLTPPAHTPRKRNHA